MALSGVRGSKWRSFLTMFGIIVGIVAVVIVVGIGEGVKRQVAGSLNQFGPDLIVVRPEQAKPSASGKGDVVFGRSSSTSLTAVDADITRRAPGVGASTPLSLMPGQLEAGDKVPGDLMVIAVSHSAPQLLNQKIEFGGFWTNNEENQPIAVLGRKAADKLFGEPVPLGKSFNFRGQDFQVRGVFEPFVQIPFSPTADFDNAVFIPYLTAAQLTKNAAGPYVILAKPAEGSELKATIESVREQLSAAHGGANDVVVQKSSDSLASGNEVIELLSMWIVAVAMVSLLMGGVGIMNIMLLIVTERTREIGVRKAVGATSRQILGQFVLEAMVLSVVGGLTGIVLSLGVIGLLRVYTDLDPVISWQAVAVAFGVSVAIGIIFGFIPAAKAARKDPIEALRHE
jgi:putative ABC transport system permease protein